MKLYCPTCRKRINTSNTPGPLPFCSEQCRLVDLGAWLNADYKIISRSADEQNDDPVEFDKQGMIQ